MVVFCIDFAFVRLTDVLEVMAAGEIVDGRGGGRGGGGGAATRGHSRMLMSAEMTSRSCAEVNGEGARVAAIACEAWRRAERKGGE